jgi:hypothetical protein
MAIAKHIIPGERFHLLAVLSEIQKPIDSPHRWVSARCDCGSIKNYVMARLRSGAVKSCGCAPRGPAYNRAHIEPGARFGRLAFIADAPFRDGNNNRRVSARCDCGDVREYFLMSLKKGETKSCGCIQREGGCYSTHGHTRGRTMSPEYYSWASMMTRCRNPKSTHYASYGGRGIMVCERWSNFDSFLADMGSRPVGTTLEREKVNGNYEAGNCVWATNKRQSNNKRDNTFIEYAGRRQTVAQWAEEFGLTYNTLLARIHRLKWAPEKALTTPAGPSYQR